MLFFMATLPLFVSTTFPFLGEKLISYDYTPLWNKFLVATWNEIALYYPSLPSSFSQPWYPQFLDEDVWEPQVLSSHSEFVDMTTFFWVPADKWVIPGLEHRAQRDGYDWNLELAYVSIFCLSIPLKIYTFVCIFFSKYMYYGYTIKLKAFQKGII